MAARAVPARALAAEIRAAVVIRSAPTVLLVAAGGGGGGDPFEQFRHFFGQMPHQFKQRGLGSGVIVSPDGYILTNNHVVGHADEIHVTLMDKREFTAKVVGKDPKTDLALIKIDTNQPLPAASLGDSDVTEVGDWVMAIGSPFGFNLTVTSGIVSAKGPRARRQLR